MANQQQIRQVKQFNAIERREEFAARLQDGSYRALLGDHLESIFRQAMENLAETGLAEEIGSLRVVLARLLAEENDLNRMATNVARIVSVSVRAVQAHSAITGQSTNKIIEALSKILDDLGGEILPGDIQSLPQDERTLP